MSRKNNLSAAVAVAAVLWSIGAAAAPAKTAAATAIDGVVDAEDLIAVGDRWVFATSYSPAAKPTGLHLIDAETRAVETVDWTGVAVRPDVAAFPRCPGAPAFAGLSTHGLDYYAERRLLYVVNHGGRESIEAFRVAIGAAGKPKLTWVGCVTAPSHTYLDAVAGIRGGELLATSLWDPEDREKEKKLADATPSGALLAWSPEGDWRPVPGSETLAAPNGLVATRDGRTVFVTAWAGKYVARLTRTRGAGYTMTKVAVPYHPDNLRWSPDRDLVYSGGQAADLEALGACLPSTEPSCPAVPLQVDAIEPRTLATRVIVPAGTYAGVNAGTGAIRVRGDYWLSSFKNTRIGIVPAK